MASCELCGKPASGKAKVEGVIFTVCTQCASLGTPVKEVAAKPVFTTPQMRVERVLIPQAGVLLRKARQQMKLTEKEAAQKLNIKESMLLHLEAGKMQPDDTLAHKLEKFYNVRLYEEL
jgi:uncharacterized protein (TIGR00270 family)